VNLILFHKPKKDQCDFCTKYKHMDYSDHASMNDKIEEHQQGKTLIRALKSKLTELAKTAKRSMWHVLIFSPWNKYAIYLQMFKWRKKTKWKLANLSSSGKYHLKLHLFLPICCWNFKTLNFQATTVPLLKPCMWWFAVLKCCWHWQFLSLS